MKLRSWQVVLVVALLAIVGLGGSALAKPVLNHLGPYELFDPNEDIVAEALEDITGYEVKYHTLPAENANEVLALRVSTPGKYDSVKMTAVQYNMLVSNGALMPLDDLLQEHGQRILEVISEESFEAAKVNGKIYGIPEKASSDNVNIAIAVRKDVLDDLGLEVPKTLDEFYHVLKTIKEETDMIPLSLYQAETHLETVMSAFGLATQWKDVDGKLVHRVQRPGMKPYLEFMNKLYEEGLIDPDFPVNNRQKVIEKFTSGRAAMMKFAWWDAPSKIPALEKNFPDAEVAIIHPLVGPNGEQGVSVATGIQWFIGIPRGAKHPEDAIKWMNAKFDEEGFRFLAIGEEGVHYEVKDGKYYPILPKFEEDRNNAHWYLTGIDEKMYPIYWRARVRKNPYMSKYYDEIMKALPICGKYDPLAYAPALPTVAKYSQSLTVLEHDWALNFIAGEESLDDFDQFVEKWLESGGAEVAAEVNEWYQSKNK